MILFMCGGNRRFGCSDWMLPEAFSSLSEEVPELMEEQAPPQQASGLSEQGPAPVQPRSAVLAIAGEQQLPKLVNT